MPVHCLPYPSYTAPWQPGAEQPSKLLREKIRVGLTPFLFFRPTSLSCHSLRVAPTTLSMLTFLMLSLPVIMAFSFCWSAIMKRSGPESAGITCSPGSL